MIKRFCKRIHLWLSIPFGLIVCLMCLSGAILIFEKDFGTIGQAEVVCDGREALPMDSIIRSTSRYLAGSNDIVGVITYADKDHAYKVMLSRPARAALWVNQYTGEVMGNYERPAIFKWASAAHRRMFEKSKSEGGSGTKVGKLIIGTTSIALLLIIITGLIVWWPPKGLVKKRLRITTSNGAYCFWFDFHCVGGIISALVLTACILTGLNWSFGWYRDAFYGALGTEVAKSSSHKTPAENYPAWNEAYSKLRSMYSGKEIRMYQNEADVVAGGPGNQQAVDTYKIDASSGEILSVTPYCEKKSSNHIKGWIYSVHVGSWLGWFTKSFYLISVLIGMLMPLTGYYLWIKRLALKRKHSK